MSTQKAGEPGSWFPSPPPIGEWRLESVADRDFFPEDATDVMSADLGPTPCSFSRPSPKPRLQHQASGLRQALLGRLRFGKTLSLGHSDVKRPAVLNPVTVITTWINATGSEQDFRLNSILLCSVPKV
jgi:hypothetical protein